MYNVDYNYDQKTFFVSKKPEHCQLPPPRRSTSRVQLNDAGRQVQNQEFWFWFEKTPSEMEVAPPHKLRSLLALLTLFTLLILLRSNAVLKRISCHFEVNFKILLVCHFFWNFLSLLSVTKNSKQQYRTRNLKLITRQNKQWEFILYLLYNSFDQSKVKWSGWSGWFGCWVGIRNPIFLLVFKKLKLRNRKSEKN